MSRRPEPVLRPGVNCWRQGRADAAFVLVDAEAYFENLFENLLRAERQIYILGWDIDSRQPLVCGEDSRHGAPVRLGELLDWLVRRRPELDVHVLCWDFSPIYLMGREAFQTVKLGWQTHERVRFHYDDQHPMTSSHHHKIVVIDDQLAYCGGLDLTSARWDTCAHMAVNELRKLPGGSAYAPFHDVQIGVTGAPAAWLGELCRERWLNATGQTLPVPGAAGDPSRFVVGGEVFRGVTTALARTKPAFKHVREVREVERLFVDMIARAERCLYIENQYLTADVIADELARSLRRREGPEVVVVLPKVQDNWLSQHTMGTLSERAVTKLRRADRYGRLGIYYPEDTDLGGEQYVNVHAKLMIVDDELVRVGSANLNNRSMGLDTECDVVLDTAGDPTARRGAQALLARLVGHHIGAEGEAVLAAWRRSGSLRQAIAALASGSKSLARFEPRAAGGALDSLLAEVELIDPPEPMGLERVVDDVVFRGRAGAGLTLAGRVPTGLMLTLFFCIVLAVLRLMTPLAPYLRAESFHRGIAAMGLEGPAELWFLAAFVTLGALFVPLNLLIVLAACLFPAMQAFALALLGSMAVALFGYGLGRVVSQRALDRAMRATIGHLGRVAARSGVLAVFLIRFFPLAPFALMNVAQGNLRVGVRPYLVGTALGLIPGTLALVAFHRSLLAAIDRPGAAATLQLALVVLGVALLFIVLARRLAPVEGAGGRPRRSLRGRARAPGYAS